jgi:hypothetical protein
VSDQSRRNFLRNASIGSAALGAAAIPFATSASASAASASAAEASEPVHHEAFAVWVADASTGDVAILAGEHELIHRDPALARRIAQIAAAKS